MKTFIRPNNYEDLCQAAHAVGMAFLAGDNSIALSHIYDSGHGGVPEYMGCDVVTYRRTTGRTVDHPGAWMVKTFKRLIEAYAIKEAEQGFEYIDAVYDAAFEVYEAAQGYGDISRWPFRGVSSTRREFEEQWARL